LAKRSLKEVLFVGDIPKTRRTFHTRSGCWISRERWGLVYFYVPDLVFIHDRAAALKNVQIYFGDGATVTRSFIRRRGKTLIGHSPGRTQLTWCEKEGVPKAIITHCGSEIVTGDEHKLSAKLRAMAIEWGIKVRIAYDGMKLEL
jgi:hypothetical protein